MSNFNQQVIEEFRANEGRVGGYFAGMSLLLLHTTGAKTGHERVKPVAYLDFEGHRYVCASKAGADTNPDWYHNLVVHPDVTAEVGTQTYPATAVPLNEDTRNHVFAELVRRHPGFGEYQQKTKRVIPMVELVPKP